MMMLPLPELSPAAAHCAADPPLAAAAAELSPAAAAAAADPPLAAAAAELSPAAPLLLLIHHLPLPDAEEDAKTCSKDILTPANAVIITTAKITGILVFI